MVLTNTKWLKELISIHLMCRFKCTSSEFLASGSKHFNTSYVSVQEGYFIVVKGFYKISIHLMCRFKYCKVSKISCFSRISIHLMCRFKEDREPNFPKYPYFNTSYVSVQALKALYLKPYTKISIHLMCRFKFVKGKKINGLGEFQYILCVGSSSCLYRISFCLTSFQYILCVGSSEI